MKRIKRKYVKRGVPMREESVKVNDGKIPHTIRISSDTVIKDIDFIRAMNPPAFIPNAKRNRKDAKKIAKDFDNMYKQPGYEENNGEPV